MAQLERVGPWGREGGSPWDDLTDSQHAGSSPLARLDSFVVTSGSLVESLQFNYLREDGRPWSGNKHGKASNNPKTINIPPHQKLVSVGLKAGAVIDAMLFVTENTATHQPSYHGPYGGTGGSPWIYVTATEIVSFFGRSGTYVDNIGLLVVGPYKIESLSDAEVQERILAHAKA